MLLAQVNLPLLLSLLPLITAIPSLIFCIAFVRDIKKTHQKMFAYLTALFFVYLLQHALAIMQYFIGTGQAAQVNFVTSQCLQILIILIFSLIIEMFENNTPYTGKQMAFAILAAITVGAMMGSPELITTALGNTFLVQFKGNATERIFQALFSVIAGFWLLFTIYVNYVKAKVQKQRSLLKALLWGAVITILVGSAFPGIIAYMTTQGMFHFDVTLVTAFWGVFQDIGIIIVGIAFMRISQDPWLLQRQQVYFVLVLTHEGLDIYSKAFRPEISPTDMTLFSGGFTAVTSMFREVTKETAEVKAILFKGRELRLLNREHFVCALLVDFSTQSSEIAHQKFANDFEAMFKEKLQDRSSGDVSAFAEADVLANFYFE